ncbi:M28 family peptidase [Sediminicola arcticus]|jgi:leucyl aminopeptidase|uniref:M28 family peptidase n=1 Tax=Sediminicola arcticus TaxID=1574308 RepID=A0ABV2SRI9_9FLAO
MKKIIRIALLALLVGCGSTQTMGTQTGVVGGPEGVKGKIVESTDNTKAYGSSDNGATTAVFSDKAKIGVIMDYLASDELQGRETGSEGIEKAADFIEAVFKNNNINPYFITYKDTLTNMDTNAYNIVGVLEGTDPVLKNEFVVIGAHYDHIGLIAPENGDTIANGANDNASGTTTVLEFARYFGNKNNNKRSLIFALFSAEEKGLLGSAHLAKRLKSKNLDLYTMLNFEMVGVPLVEKDYYVYVTGYEMSNLAAISNGYAGEKLVGFLPTAKEYNLFQRSDNYPFDTEFSVPSQTYCTFDFTNFDFYHKVGDEPEIMDYEHMANFVNKMYPVLEKIINAPIKEIKYN